MSIADTKAQIHELLVAGFARRGFSFSKLPRKVPDHRRRSPFVRAVALEPPAPTATWTITADVRGVRRGTQGYVLLDLACEARIDAVADLVGNLSPPVKGFEWNVPSTFSFTPGGVTRGEARITHVDAGHDPAPAVDELFSVVDTLVIPRLEKYSILENMVEALTPRPSPSAEPLGGRRTPAEPEEPPVLDGASPGMCYPWTVMSAIGGAYVLGRLDLCETIAARGRASYADAPEGSLAEDLNVRLARQLSAFYERHLKDKGVRPDAWLGPA